MVTAGRQGHTNDKGNANAGKANNGNANGSANGRSANGGIANNTASTTANDAASNHQEEIPAMTLKEFLFQLQQGPVWPD